MKNPAALLPTVTPAVRELVKATRDAGVSEATLGLVHLRASQVNGCGFCVDYGVRAAVKGGETPDRLAAVAAWRGTSYFTGAERAALALTEAATRLGDRSDAVPDAVWDEAARHYDERALAALVLMIGVTNLFNRFNVTTRQPAGSWG